MQGDLVILDVFDYPFVSDKEYREFQSTLHELLEEMGELSQGSLNKPLSVEEARARASQQYGYKLSRLCKFD